MRLISTVIFVFVSLTLFSQVKDSIKVVQFSGVVVTEDEYGEMVPLPYTAISIKGTSRGTHTEIDGFFSLVARAKDTLVFSRLGFENVEQIVPDTLDSDFYSWYQVMSQDDILLPEAVIYPWPSRDHYKIEFLALDVSNEMRERAAENLAEDILERMQSTVPSDGDNAFEIENQKIFEGYRYAGQYKPQKIFDVVAWSKFIKAWKNGDFKRKKKKDKN